MEMIGTLCINYQETIAISTDTAEILVFVHIPSYLSAIASMGFNQNRQMIGKSIAGQVGALEGTIKPAKMEKGLKESAV